jgi:hypothetical protein
MNSELELFGWYNPITEAGLYVEFSDEGLQKAIQNTGINVDTTNLGDGFLSLKNELKKHGFVADVVNVLVHDSDCSFTIWKSVRNKLEKRHELYKQS